MAKDYSEEEIKQMHADLNAMETVDARDAYYKKHKVTYQRLNQMFLKVGLGKLTKAAPSTKPKSKVKAKAAPAAKVKSGAKKVMGKKPKPAKKAAPKAVVKQPVAPRNPSSISAETKELIARALLKLLEE